MGKYHCLAGAISFICLSFSSFGQNGYDRNQLSLFYQNQEFEKAINYLQANSPVQDNSQYNVDLGYAFFMNDELDLSKKEFETVYQQQPANKQANIYLAQLFSLKKMPDSALFYYRNLTRLQPENYRFWQKSAQLFNDLSRFDSALIYIEKAYSLHHLSGRLTVQYTDQLIRSKQYDKAETLLNNFLTSDSSDQDVMIKRIELSFKKPDYPTAIFWGERLLRDSVDVVMPYVNLAYSYLNTDSFDKCIMLCEWLMVNNKATQSVLYCAALAYSKKKEYKKSNELLDECLSLSIQKDAVGYFNAKSDNFEAMKQYQKAMSYYDTSYYLFQSPPDLYYKGRIYDKYLKNKAKAKLYYLRFMDKRKIPRHSGEVKVFNYIREYLKPGN